MPNDAAPTYMFMWSCPNGQTCNTESNILTIPVVSTNDGGEYSCTVSLLINNTGTFKSFKFTFTVAVSSELPFYLCTVLLACHYYTIHVEFRSHEKLQCLMPYTQM